MEKLTKQQFLSFYINTSNYESASACYEAIDNSLTLAGINSPMTLIGALATIRTEVGKAFLPTRENISQTQACDYYTGILGNRENTLDGYIYRGGGLIQLTGRDNYIHYGTAIGVNLVDNPNSITDLITSAKVLAQYFKERNVNVACDNQDWTKVRELVNGGDNGLDVFLSIVRQYLDISNVPNVQTSVAQPIKTMEPTEIVQVLKVSSIVVTFDRFENGEQTQTGATVNLKVTPELLTAMKMEDAGLVEAGYNVTLEA